MPHASAKVVDKTGRIVPIGHRGELCIAGYQLSKGYWNNAFKTRETFVTDDAGVTWLKTGDEALFAEQGYCTITGRLKDIIIRGMKLPSRSRLTASGADSIQAAKTSTPLRSKNGLLHTRLSRLPP